MSAVNVQFSVAAHIMVALSCRDDEEITSAMLADSVNADPSFVRKLVSKLAKAGLIKTTRGKGGACTLSRPPEAITLLDIYRASKVPPAFAVHAYPIEAACATSCCFKELMTDILHDAQGELEKCLAKHTLGDLMGGVSKKNLKPGATVHRKQGVALNNRIIA